MNYAITSKRKTIKHFSSLHFTYSPLPFRPHLPFCSLIMSRSYAPSCSLTLKRDATSMWRHTSGYHRHPQISTKYALQLILCRQKVPSCSHFNGIWQQLKLALWNTSCFENESIPLHPIIITRQNPSTILHSEFRVYSQRNTNNNPKSNLTRCTWTDNRTKSRDVQLDNTNKQKSLFLAQDNHPYSVDCILLVCAGSSLAVWHDSPISLHSARPPPPKPNPASRNPLRVSLHKPSLDPDINQRRALYADCFGVLVLFHTLRFTVVVFVFVIICKEWFLLHGPSRWRSFGMVVIEATNG